MPNYKGFQTRLSPQDKEQIRSLYLSSDESPKEIADRFKCSRGNFWNIVKELKLEVRANRVAQQVRQLQEIPEAKKGWIAGIVDGEGYIGISKSGIGHLATRVSVSSTTDIMQEELRRLIGGTVCQKKPSDKHVPQRNKPTSCWSIWSPENVGSFLEVILPYLVVKTQVAKVVLDFCQRRMKLKRTGYTPEDWQSLKDVRRLNHKGTLPQRNDEI